MFPRMDTAGVLLTGATGFVGRYVLLELLQRRQHVTALVRPSDTASGEERLRSLMRSFGWPDEWNRQLSVIESTLPNDAPDQLPPLEKAMASCDRVIHCAAALNFDRNRDSEPQRTNVDGTIQLGRLAADCGIRRFLYVSTAYVCGRMTGAVDETVGNAGEPRNDYEASKQQAERWLVQKSGLDWTIVRPGIVVGDSRTGHTGNYFGIYRVLRSIARLCSKLPVDQDGIRHLPLRLKLSGKEASHLIPVDFVSAAIADLALRDDVARECVHLTPDRPTTTATLLEAIGSFHRLQGIEFVGAENGNTAARNVYERIFDRETQIVSQYFEDDPTFDTTNRRRLIPGFPDTPVDESMLIRLQAFGAADDWGHVDRIRKSRGTFDCTEFFLRHFPAAAADSRLPQVPGLSAVVRFEIRGSDNGDWLCRLAHGRVVDIACTNGRATGADFLYQTDSDTFQQIVAGCLNIRQAFFERRINIDGDIERALLLAVLFEDLLQESPYHTAATSGDDTVVKAEKFRA